MKNDSLYELIERDANEINAILNGYDCYTERLSFIQSIVESYDKSALKDSIKLYKKTIKLLNIKNPEAIKAVLKEIKTYYKTDEESLNYYIELLKLYVEEMYNAGIINKKERNRVGNIGFNYYREFTIRWFLSLFSSFRNSNHYGKNDQDKLMVEERFFNDDRTSHIKDIYKSCIYMLNYPAADWMYIINERVLRNSEKREAELFLYKDFKTDKEAYEWFREMLKVFADLLLRRGIITKYEHAKAYKKPSMLNRIKNKIKEL